MKVISRKEDHDVIDFTKLNDDHIIIVRRVDNKDFGFITREQYRSGNYVIKMFDDLTAANGLGYNKPSLREILRELVIDNPFIEVYAYKNIKEAMEDILVMMNKVY